VILTLTEQVVFFVYRQSRDARRRFSAAYCAVDTFELAWELGICPGRSEILQNRYKLIEKTLRQRCIIRAINYVPSLLAIAERICIEETRELEPEHMHPKLTRHPP
jgi:hypothetical protein